MDDDYFTNQGGQNAEQQEYVPPAQEQINENEGEVDPPVQAAQNNEAPAFDFSSYPSTEPVSAPYVGQSADNEFNDFEEDEMTRRIREEEERIQTQLRQKSQKEYEQKNERKDEGRRQFEEFLNKKEQEKEERAQENIKKQDDLRAQYKKLTLEAGWKKVISNINIKQGEHKGKSDINRMRESILHKREDDARS